MRAILKNKVLITGGLGFIGANLVRRLDKRGDVEVSVLDNLSMGDPDKLQDAKFELIKGDIEDNTLVKSAVKNSDVVVHLAADTRVLDSIANPIHNFKSNVNGTLNILEAMRAYDVKNIIFASTGGAIGGEVTPPLNEEIVAKPLSPYGASKLSCEGYLNAYGASYDINSTALRFSNVYGPHSYHKGSVVAAFLKSILRSDKHLQINGDGNQTRDFVYIDDLVDALEFCILNGTNGVYQLGSGIETSLLELVSILEQTVGVENMLPVIHGPALKGEVLRNYSDISKAKSELQYSPRIDLSDGMLTTWEWFKRNKEIFANAA